MSHCHRCGQQQCRCVLSDPNGALRMSQEKDYIWGNTSQLQAEVASLRAKLAKTERQRDALRDALVSIEKGYRTNREHHGNAAETASAALAAIEPADEPCSVCGQRMSDHWVVGGQTACPVADTEPADGEGK